MDLMIQDPIYTNLLDIRGLSSVFGSVSNSYKFYWFDAILELIKRNSKRDSFSFDEIANQMIADAWFSVAECYLSIGIANDALESVVKRLKVSDPYLKGSASREEILRSIAIQEQRQKDIKTLKQQMVNMVPYRFLSEFIGNDKALKACIAKPKQFVEAVNASSIAFPYTFEYHKSQMERRIVLHPIWKQMFIDYYPILKNWVLFEKVSYLQSRNPTVPGIIYKLQAENGVRKLTKVRELWKQALEIKEFNDIYTNEPLNGKEYAIDHFIPWSYIAHDEMWNLIPADCSMNSRKSNLLPKWDTYFEPFAHEQYKMYELIQTESTIRDCFNNCRADNLNSIWGQSELYRPGNSEVDFMNILDKNMRPIFDAAKIQGYAEDIFQHLL